MAESPGRLRSVFFLFSSAHLLAFLLLSCLLELRSVAQKLPDEEVVALKQIATKLKMRWDFNLDPCSGSGQWMNVMQNGVVSNVTCDCTYNQSTVCHVKDILLKRQNLTGVLPKEFANLQFLEDIDLSLNYLNGSIPREWASLPLFHLSVVGNRITGTIPKEFGRMATLTSLVVNDNLLSGPLPEELGNLVNLKEFIASANNFSGPLPESYGKLRNLTNFMIDGNSISGKMPSFIGNWRQLVRLDMQGTSMEGPIPNAISFLTNLQQLRISDLKGPTATTFPPLGSITDMRILILRNCKISGEIPQFIGDNMNRLGTLDLSFNNLTGKIPDNLQELSQINYMYLSNNMLTGELPERLFQRTASVDLSNNNFTSPLPPTNCQQGNVNLVGSYSSVQDSTVAACSRKNNPCSGKAQYYSLFINCGGAKAIVNDHEYEEDSSNKGPANYVPTKRWAYSSTGNYMDADAAYIATNTSALNMRNPDLYMTARLAPLSLKYYGLCLQNGNYSVQLHFAEIMFTADQTVSSVGRRIFDVSIQGKKVLQDFNIEDNADGPGRPLVLNFTTNVTTNTLEIDFYWAGKGTTSVPARGVYGPLVSAITVTPNFKPHIDGHKLSAAAISGIVIASVCCIVGLILVLLWMRGCFSGKDPTEEELRSLELPTGYFSLKQIKAVTNNFDPSNKIGEGGFGPVYKGILPDGALVAIKQLSSVSKQGSREFINEIGMISAVQHPNLVKLYGCCVERNQLLVIYEFMENNNLARALFGPEEHRLKLDWTTRRKICMGIARGLAHLHDESRIKIVHRDIKATNILLDRDLNAKISDFGLAKLNEDEDTHISTRIAGTIGYMAPEYAMRGYLTDKADVYSFGVVLLEIVSGKSNMNYQPGGELVNLLDMAYVLHEKGKLLELVDTNLGSKYSKDEALRMLSLVLLCTNRSPTIRPTMSEVVSILENKKTVKVPQVSLKSEKWRFTEFSKVSQNSQSKSLSGDGPWFDSSVTLSSRDESTGSDPQRTRPSMT